MAIFESVFKSIFSDALFSSPFAGVSGVSEDTAFHPVSLFTVPGSVGTIIDPSVMSSLYQDEAVTTPVTAVGQVVKYAADQSGNNKHLTQETTSKAFILRESASGKRYLESDGIDDFMTFPTLGAGLQQTVLIAVSVNTGSLSLIIESSENTNYYSGAYFCAADPSAGSYSLSISQLGNGNFNAAKTPLIPQVVPCVIAITIDRTLPDYTDQRAVLINSITQTMQDANNGNVQNIPFHDGPYFVGARSDSGFPTALDLYGLIIINRVLTPDELANTEQWLASKMGITL